MQVAPEKGTLDKQKGWWPVSTEETGHAMKLSYAIFGGSLIFVAFIAMMLALAPSSSEASLTGLCASYDTDGNNRLSGEEFDVAVVDMVTGVITIAQFETVVSCFASPGGNTEPTATPTATPTPEPPTATPTPEPPTATPTPACSVGNAQLPAR